jgi:hypothetical protein
LNCKRYVCCFSKLYDNISAKLKRLFSQKLTSLPENRVTDREVRKGVFVRPDLVCVWCFFRNKKDKKSQTKIFLKDFFTNQKAV